MGEDKVTVKVNDMSLLNNEDDIIEDIVLVEIKKFLYNHLPRAVYMNCIEDVYNPNYFYQHDEFISVPIAFYGIRINSREINKSTYCESSPVSCSRLHLKKVDGEYVINPNFVRWPIILQNIKLNHLPSYVKFYKNPEEKKPLLFIVKETGEDNWIYDLPKGSIVLLIQSDFISIFQNIDCNWLRGRYDFLNDPNFVTFISDHGKTYVI